MKEIEKLQALSSVQLAKIFNSDSDRVVDLEDISELEIYELLESRTKGFESVRVKLMLDEFLREPNENLTLIERYQIEVKELKNERSELELETFWLELEESKIYQNLNRDIDRYNYEIALLQKKIRLCDYIIELLSNKLGQSQQFETSEKRLLNTFFSKYPQAEHIFKCCVKAGLLDDNYKPIKRYVETVADKAFLADLIGKKLKIENRWIFFQKYWDVKGFANVISRTENNYSQKIKHEIEIERIFKEAIKDK